MYEDERTALRVVLLLGVGCFVAAVLVSTPPPPPHAASAGSAPIVSQTSNGLFRSIGER
jgi:hypothetical protein